jgi:nicotinate-nucleotide adenylyltransferase
MKIAVLGGSFDPPHKGHVIIARRLLALFHFDEIWFMPCYQHPFNKNLSSPDQRLEMTKYLENDLVKVSDLEISKKTISYTIDTLRFLTKKRPQDKFCWVIGTDQLSSFTKWKKWKEIVNNYTLIVVPRTGFKKAEQGRKNIVLINRKKFPPIYISSTLVKKRIKENKSISNMVPKKVEEYIIQNKLYV